MNDAIKQAIEALEEDAKGYAAMGWGSQRIDAALAALRAQPTGWIAVTERLPEPEVDVLCYGVNTIHPELPRLMFVDWYGSKPDFGRGVTHWRPLPPPPADTLESK